MANVRDLSQRELQEALFVQASQIRQAALQYDDMYTLEDLLFEDLDNDEDREFWRWDFTRTQERLRDLGYSLEVAAATLTGDSARGPYNQDPKCTEFFDIALGFPDRNFRQEFRVSRKTFDRLVELLEKNDIFLSRGKKPQRPVRFQLGCYLMRYGQLGGNALSVAHRMGVSVGAVVLYCTRVTRAFRELGLVHLQWGDDERHGESKAHFGENGFHGCIGIVDGSLIRLTSLPYEQGATYLCRKKYPAVNIQAIVDHAKRFIAYEGGWPGSTNDASIWKGCWVWLHRHQLFRDGEYLLADKGYPSSRWLLRPFTEPEIAACNAAEASRRRRFNKLISNKRIYVEHAFGMLKGRFPALKAFATPNNINDVFRVVESLMVVHNICIDLGDEPERIWGYNPDEEEAAEIPEYGGERGNGDVDIPAEETVNALRTAGHEFRLELMNMLID